MLTGIKIQSLLKLYEEPQVYYDKYDLSLSTTKILTQQCLDILKCSNIFDKFGGVIYYIPLFLLHDDNHFNFKNEEERQETIKYLENKIQIFNHPEIGFIFDYKGISKEYLDCDLQLKITSRNNDDNYLHIKGKYDCAVIKFNFSEYKSFIKQFKSSPFYFDNKSICYSVPSQFMVRAISALRSITQTGISELSTMFEQNKKYFDILNAYDLSTYMIHLLKNNDKHILNPNFLYPTCIVLYSKNINDFVLKYSYLNCFSSGHLYNISNIYNRRKCDNFVTYWQEKINQVSPHIANLAKLFSEKINDEVKIVEHVTEINKFIAESQQYSEQLISILNKKYKS